MSDLTKIVQLVANDPRVVAIGTEGSQNDPQVHADAWSDLDVTVFVREALADPWALVQALGQPVMWQHLLNRDLFGPSSAIWDTYLVRYAGTRRIDWKFAPIADLDAYLAADTLNQIVWQNGVAVAPQTTSAQSHAVKLPSESEWLAVVNEVLWCAGNVEKALHRQNLVHANEQLNANVRPGVLRLLSWQAALNQPDLDAGSQWKFLAAALPVAQQQVLSQSYAQADLRQTQASLHALLELTAQVSRQLAKQLRFDLPEWFEPGLAQLRQW